MLLKTLPIALLMLVLAGCSRESEPSAEPTEAAPEALTTEPAAEAPMAEALPSDPLAAAVDGAWRKPEDKTRDVYRHPGESLAFWGLQPGMTILEVQPGGGWWTDILAPYAKATGGTFYATASDLDNPELSDAARSAREAFAARYAGLADTHGEVKLVNWGPKSAPLPAETFDFILTARSVHGWMGNDMADKAFADLFAALKPGGILALEQHRANPGEQDPKAETGYVTEAYVVELATKAGFELAAQSEINANPKDTKDHPFGVWTLPPVLRDRPYGDDTAQPDPAFDPEPYKAIGESDRMTLRFVKPASAA